MAIYVELKTDESDQDQESGVRTERKRAARRRGARRSRPDASGRINSKECHLFAFSEQLEAKVAEAMKQN